jgi:hypothetical protein
MGGNGGGLEYISLVFRWLGFSSDDLEPTGGHMSQAILGRRILKFLY